MNKHEAEKHQQKNVYTRVVPNWLLVILFGITAISAIIGGIVFFDHQAQSIEQQKANELQSIATLKVDQIVQWLNERTSDAQLNSNSAFFDYAVSGWVSNPEDEVLRNNLIKRLRLITNIQEYKNVLLTTGDGKSIISVDPTISSLAPEIKTLINKSKTTNMIVMGDLIRDNENGTITLNIIAPIPNGTKTPTAFLVLQADPEKYLYPIIQSWPIPSKSAETLLIRREGDDAIYLNTLRFRSDPPLTIKVPLTELEVLSVKASLGQTGVIEGHDYRGIEVLSDVISIPGTSWYLEAKVNADEILAEVNSLEKAVIVIVTLCVLMTLLLAAYLFKNRERWLYRQLFRAEKEQREAQEETRITLYSIGDGVITTDEKSLITRMNPIAETLTGWKEAEAIGKPLSEVFEIINENTELPVENPVQKVLDGGGIVGLANHTVLIARDGTRKPIADSSAPICDEKGKISGVVLIFRDQTGERAAQREHALLNYTLENSTNEIYLFDVETLKFRFVNQGAAKNLGYAQEQLLKMTPVDIKPFLTYESFLEMLTPVIQGEISTLVFETIHQRANGSTYPVEVHLQMFEFEKEHVFLAIINDITQRQKTEAAQKTSEERFRRLFEHAAVGVALIETKTGRYLDINKRYCDFLGYTKDEMLNFTFQDVSEKVTGQMNVEKNALLQAGEISEFTIEKRYIRKDGKEVWGELTVSPLWTPGEEEEDFVHIAVVKDISDRKKVEDELALQLHELKRWHSITLGREMRILELKKEVNDLLIQNGLTPRYGQKQ